MTGIADMSGRTVVITGCTSGIGRVAAVRLAGAGARVVAAVRDEAKGALLAQEISEATGDSSRLLVVPCELASFRSVRQAASQIAAECATIEVLCNNAALIARSRSLTEDGNELTFQVNYLSHYLLTRLLLERLSSARNARIICVSSDAHLAQYSGIRFDDLGFERGWMPFRAYAHSKLANIMFAYELARRVEPAGIAAYAMHPGPVSSNLGRSGWGFAGSVWNRLVPKLNPEQGADTLVYLASDPSVAELSGKYFYKRAPKRSSRASYDHAAQSRLWAVSATIVGEPEAPAASGDRTPEDVAV